MVRRSVKTNESQERYASYDVCGTFGGVSYAYCDVSLCRAHAQMLDAILADGIIPAVYCDLFAAYFAQFLAEIERSGTSDAQQMS